jgi:trehalose 6-phosphate phosphatase
MAELARRGSLLIATDFDGTLAPVVRDPRRARPLAAASRALGELAGHTTVAIISGRDLANLSVQCPVPGVLLLGSYGLEPWWRLSPAEPMPNPRPSQQLLQLAFDLRVMTAGLPGVQVEAKSFGVAIHYRNAPEPRRVAPTVRRLGDRVAAERGLQVMRGKLVVELRPPRSGNKGGALALLLDHLAPRGCVFAGDDYGDLPAMRELKRRKNEMELAIAIGVLGADAQPELNEVADLCLEGPLAWAQLLAEVAVAVKGRSAATGRAGR